MMDKLANGFEWDATHMWTGGSPSQPLLNRYENQQTVNQDTPEDSMESNEMLYL